MNSVNVPAENMGQRVESMNPVHGPAENACEKERA
jgi:hypothetical protein